MHLTVAICTWNRARLLDETLQHLGCLIVPAGVDWELLVVNNNSTDNTDEVIARHLGRLPLRRLHEARQGLSNARNRAVAEARGEAILWTDDDVLVDPNWLAAYARALTEWREAVYFGGPIDPWFAAPPPAWVRRSFEYLGAVYAILPDHGSSRPLTGEESPFGANMAFRTEVLRRHTFDSQVGYSGKEVIGGEETHLVARLRSQGLQGAWVAAARVRHYVPADRLTPEYVWRRCSGCGKAYVRQPETRARMERPVRRLYDRCRYWESRLRSWCLAGFKGPAWARAFMRAGFLHGMLEELRDRRLAA